jgi:hypothetical protein
MTLPRATKSPGDVGVTKIIKVAVETIQRNFRLCAEGRHAECSPAVVVRVPQPEGGHQIITAYSVNIKGPSRVIQNDIKPDLTGARVWIETEAEVECITERG